ncbi:MAG TPA: dihydrolipoamide acetyltransferase family protein [Gaiellaceae bacterium]|nr:dihydrolipoamide acetyltransferase family protein [Gaiellaceae bacterium]
MAYEFKLPDLGEGLTEGEVARWLVSEGEEIAEDQPLVEVQTDKTTVEIPSPAAGKVTRILVGEGETVPVGTLLVVIGEAAAVTDEQPRAEPAPQQDAAVSATPGGQSQGQSPAAAGRVRATPLVRRLAQELGVDLASVQATGPQGRVSEADVRRAATSGGPTSGGLSQGLSPVGAEPGREGRRVPLRGVRRKIAEHLATAHREVPAVTVVEECDFTALDARRGERSFLPYVLQAVVDGLRAVPELNARLEEDEIVYLDRYDLGVAVQTDQGLVVPVLADAGRRSLGELEAEAARLAGAARAGKLTPEELRGSTFTVTSGGRLGGVLATPLVNYPEVGILGVHRITERPAVRDGEIVVRKLGYLSCTFDHRVVDGVRATEFLLAVIERLERPE